MSTQQLGTKVCNEMNLEKLFGSSHRFNEAKRYINLISSFDKSYNTMDIRGIVEEARKYFPKHITTLRLGRSDSMESNVYYQEETGCIFITIVMDDDGKISKMPVDFESDVWKAFGERVKF